MSKICNFGSGPSKLPPEVYNMIRIELTNYNDTGISILETSHRSDTYQVLHMETQDLVRKLLKVPLNYIIIFMAGGSQGQFAAVPLNLISSTGTADYVITGIWSAIAAKEAQKYGKINMVLPPTEKYIDIPDQSTWNLDPNASYVHICDNDTINGLCISGVEFNFIPDTKGVPLVADMSSNIMSKPVDISKFGVIYGCAQKNMGTAGVTLVIAREDLLNRALPICPSFLDWTVNYTSFIFNTPPILAVYVMNLDLKWIEDKGNLDIMALDATQKSSMIYDFIDTTEGFYHVPVLKNVRSKMNIPFRIKEGDDELEAKFLEGAEEKGLLQLKGHKLVGGIRVSTYNAVTLDDVETLLTYMKDFYKKHV